MTAIVAVMTPTSSRSGRRLHWHYASSDDRIRAKNVGQQSVSSHGQQPESPTAAVIQRSKALGKKTSLTILHTVATSNPVAQLQQSVIVAATRAFRQMCFCIKTGFRPFSFLASHDSTSLRFGVCRPAYRDLRFALVIFLRLPSKRAESFFW